MVAQKHVSIEDINNLLDKCDATRNKFKNVTNLDSIKNFDFQNSQDLVIINLAKKTHEEAIRKYYLQWWEKLD